MNRITATCRAVLNWLEHGDLVPLIILVSAWHYSVILSEHDHVIAAVSIGTLVDLGHYRWTKAAVRYPGDNWKEKYGRWAMVLIMSAIALNYQQRFYNDWWLSIPMPLLIASLAWLNQKDSKAKKSEKTETSGKFSENPQNTELLPEITKQEPEDFKPKITWKDLLSHERAALAGMSVKEILEKYKDYQVSERTARNWKAAGQRNGQSAKEG